MPLSAHRCVLLQLCLQACPRSAIAMPTTTTPSSLHSNSHIYHTVNMPHSIEAYYTPCRGAHASCHQRQCSRNTSSPLLKVASGVTSTDHPGEPGPYFRVTCFNLKLYQSFGMVLNAVVGNAAVKHLHSCLNCLAAWVLNCIEQLLPVQQLLLCGLAGFNWQLDCWQWQGKQAG